MVSQLDLPRYPADRTEQPNGLRQWRRSMSSDLILKRSRLDLLRARRQPNFQVLVASNAVPAVDPRCPMEQRHTIITVGRLNCRWPIGDPQEPGFYFCGANTGGHSSYCTHHMAVAHVPTLNPKRAA